MVVMAFTFGRAMAWCFRKLNPFFMVIGVMMFIIPLLGLFHQNNLAIHIAIFAGILSYFPMFNFFEAIGNFSLKNPENDRPKPSKITEDLEGETTFRSAPFGNSRNYYEEKDSQPSDNNYDDDFEDYSSPPPQGSQDRFEQERADFEEYKEATAEELKRAFDEYMHEEIKKHAEEMKRREEELKRREEELNRKEESFKNERTRKAGNNSKDSSSNEQKYTGSSNKKSSNDEQKSTGSTGAESKTDSSYDDRFYTNEKPLDPTKLTDAYKILGITLQTSKKDAKRAFMKLRSLYSPDKVDHLGEERVKRNTEQMKIINVAWDKVKKTFKK